MSAAGAPGLILPDSVTSVEPQHAGCAVVTGAHGGASVVRDGRAVRALPYVFNDAGIGRDDAGVAAREALQQVGITAATVLRVPARSGEARDRWEHGMVPRADAQPILPGVRVGERRRDAVKAA